MLALPTDAVFRPVVTTFQGKKERPLPAALRFSAQPPIQQEPLFRRLHLPLLRPGRVRIGIDDRLRGCGRDHRAQVRTVGRLVAGITVLE